MPASETIQELARQVRGKTIEILRAAREQWLLWAPPGTSNHMLWHAGHALWLQDVLSMRVLTGEERLPDGWAETFGMNCRPVVQTRDWPGRHELLDRLESQLEAIVRLYAETSEATLQEMITGPNSPRPRLARLVHGWHDEAVHQGEMYLLLKLCHAGHWAKR